MARFHNHFNRNNRNNQNNQDNGNNNFNNNNRRNSNLNGNNGNNRNGNRNQGNNQNGNVFQGNCRKCGRPGHRAADCRAKTNNGHNNNGVSRVQNTNRNNGRNGRHGSQAPGRWCIYCNRDNHNTENCRYPPKICENCLKKGHLKDECHNLNDPNFPIKRDANESCNWCHQPWHAGRECLERQIEERGARNPTQDQLMGNSPATHTAEIIQLQIAPQIEWSNHQPSNPLATMSSQAWAPSIFTTNLLHKEQHRHTCETCESSTHRTIECSSIRPCSACHSPFHSRADCLDTSAAQPFLKPAVVLWQKRAEHEHESRYCVYCNAVGHTTEACTNEAALTAHLVSSLRCGQCGKRGHGDARCLNPAAQWGGPPTLQNLPEQDWTRAWMAGWRPACSKCEFAMDVYDVWNSDADAAMGGCVCGRLFIPAHVCKESVVWWVKMEY